MWSGCLRTLPAAVINWSLLWPLSRGDASAAAERPGPRQARPHTRSCSFSCHSSVTSGSNTQKNIFNKDRTGPMETGSEWALVQFFLCPLLCSVTGSYIDISHLIIISSSCSSSGSGVGTSSSSDHDFLCLEQPNVK